MLETREADGVVSFGVRVQPRAARDEIVGERGGELLVRIQAAPVEGAANASLLRLLARALEVPPSALQLLRGATGRRKLVRARGVRAAQVLALAGR